MYVRKVRLLGELFISEGITPPKIRSKSKKDACDFHNYVVLEIFATAIRKEKAN